jgi:carbon storage regulator
MQEHVWPSRSGYERSTAHGREAQDMLVLTRKSNQSIMIGDDIEVSVLAVMGEKVRIGISAPRDVPVFRKEVYLEIKLDQTDDSDQRAAVAKALAELKGN